jgi:hypothetical protein
MDSSYNSFNSNQTNFDEKSQSSRKRNEITSILNNRVTSGSNNYNPNSSDRNNYDTNDDMISLEGKPLPTMTKKFFGNVNQSCMNFKKKTKTLFTKEEEPLNPMNRKNNMLTHSMIVSNFIETPIKRMSNYRNPIPSHKMIRQSLKSQKSVQYQRSTSKKSPDSSFLISKKTLSPIQMAGGESFLKVNLSKIPSDTGKNKKKRKRVQECQPKESYPNWTK